MAVSQEEFERRANAIKDAKTIVEAYRMLWPDDLRPPAASNNYSGLHSWVRSPRNVAKVTQFLGFTPAIMVEWEPGDRLTPRAAERTVTALAEIAEVVAALPEPCHAAQALEAIGAIRYILRRATATRGEPKEPTPT